MSLDSDKFPGYNPLHFAIDNQCLDTLELLLNHGAYVKAKAKGGITSLHLSLEHFKVQIIEALLRSKADVGIKHPHQGVHVARGKIQDGPNLLAISVLPTGVPWLVNMYSCGCHFLLLGLLLFLYLFILFSLFSLFINQQECILSVHKNLRQ